MALFRFGKEVEKLAVVLRVGEFEGKSQRPPINLTLGSQMPPTYKCPACASSLASRPCEDCQASWLHELHNLDYSDAYEARLSRTLGVAGLATGLTGWVANAGLGWFEFGGLLGGITETIRAHLPAFLSASSVPIETLCIAVFSLSLLALLCVVLILSFIMAMNPNGERHWRHMTPRMYGLLFLYVIVEVVVLIAGVSVMDILVVVGPLMIGAMGCAAPWCMRKGEERKLKLEDGLKKGEESV